MNESNYNKILINVLSNYYKIHDVSNIIDQYFIYSYGKFLYIGNLLQDKNFIIYEYTSDSLIYLQSIDKVDKNIYLVNNPKRIHTDKYSCIYYNSIKHIKISYSESRVNNFNCLFLCKDLKHNLIEYIYRTKTELYAFIIKYKINNLFYKMNVNNRKNIKQLVLINKLFIYYNFSYSYKFCYLL